MSCQFLVCAAGPTREINPRMELCGKVLVQGKSKWMFVRSFTKAVRSDFVQLAKQLATAINAKGLSKTKALELRDHVMHSE